MMRTRSVRGGRFSTHPATHRSTQLATHLATVLLAMALSGAASAHEFWVLPERFAVEPSMPFSIGLRVGEGWPGEAVPRKPQRIARLATIDAGGERPIGGRAGDEPVGVATGRSPGTALVVYRSRPASIVLDAERFEAYLRDEGLDAIVAERVRRGESARPGRERYSRCAKALVRVAGVPAGFDRVARLALELVPVSDPMRLDASGTLVVRLLLRGRPLAHARIEALHRQRAAPAVVARTDGAGRAVLELPVMGVWLLDTVHMTRARSRDGADWESLWSSLTIEVAQSDVASSARPVRRGRIR